MHNNHKYILSSNTIPKLNCPYCGAKKHWQRYINTETGEVLPKEYGKCDNEVKCGKWIKVDAKCMHRGNTNINAQKLKIRKRNSEQVFIPYTILQETLSNYNLNTFIKNLEHKGIPRDSIYKMLELYYLGTNPNNYMQGAVTFPFINANGNIAAIQAKTFNKNNHTIKTNYLHSIIEITHAKMQKCNPAWLTKYKNNENVVTCFFGEHLLKEYPNNTIALVEAPKTAIYGTLYFGMPDNPENYLWLAVGARGYLTLDRIKALEGRNIVLFPDLSSDGSTYNFWKDKAIEFAEQLSNTTFSINQLLENNANKNNREKGFDLADFLHEIEWKEFQLALKENKTQQTHNDEPAKKEEPNKQERKAIKVETISKWDIDFLEDFFNKFDVKSSPIKVSDGIIMNPVKFIQSHLIMCKANNGNKTFRPYLDRLLELKKLFEWQN